jgi:hypothetical protein
LEKRNKPLLSEALQKLFQKRALTQAPAAIQNIGNESTEFVYIYTDIIKPRYISDILARYLRVIPNASTNRHIRFKHIEYIPIETTYIESISILITDGQGEKVNFNSSSTPTYVMLHFKKDKL